MKRAIAFLAQKPRLVNIFVGLIIVVGLLTVWSMRANFLPPEPVSFINVSVVYRGASPQEVEEEVVNKVEEAIEGLAGIERVTSTARESFALVNVELQEQANPNAVLQDVNNAVKGITTFPPGADVPVIAKQEVLNYTMTVGIAGATDLSTLKEYAKNIKDRLLLSPSLSQVTISGFPEEEIEVRLRQKDLKAYELTFDEVSRAIQSTNLKATGGEIETGTQKILIRLDSRNYFAKDLMNTVVKATADGKVVYLKDVAQVQDRFANKPNRTYVNGQPAVIMKVFSRAEEDILGNAAFVSQYLEEFNARNTVVQAITIEDKSISLLDAIGTLQNNAWQGILLVLVVLGLFLHPRIAFWVAFKIPVALLGMFILSNFYDLTINQVSLFGTIVVLGIIVDDGVVVAENIYEKYLSGMKPLKAALIGTVQVVPAILSSLVTTALAFSLFFFLDGQLGDYFSDISFVVCATLFVALLESLLFLPVHIARSKALTPKGKPWKLTQWSNQALIGFRDKVYARIIGFSLKAPVVAVLLVLGFMGLTIQAQNRGIIKGTFFPTIDQDVITAKLELPLGTDESLVKQKLDAMERAVWQVNNYYTNQRADGDSVIRFVEKTVGPNSNEGSLNIYMMEGDARNIKSFDIASSIRQEVGPIPQATNLSYGSIAVFGKPVSIALVGSNMDQLRQAKALLRQYLEQRTDLKDVTDTDKLGMPELEMTLTPKARLLGLTEAQVFNQIRKGFFGLEAQSLQRGDEEVKVWVRYDEQDRRSVQDLQNARFFLPNGQAYPMSQLATFKSATNVTEINHQSGQREIRVEADVANLMVSVPNVLAQAQATVLQDIQRRFPDLRYTLEGEARLSAETQTSSQQPSIIVFILIIVVLLLNYRSWGKTLAILAMLPFAFVGVAWGSFIHNIPVSIFSVLGMIALWGVLINNGLVLISAYNQNIAAGLKVGASLKQAAISRFRPIVLTTITTVFGLAPLLLNNSISAQFLKPTAIAIAYGLIFGTVLTLVFLPSVLLLVSHAKALVFKLFNRKVKVRPEQLDIVLKEVNNKLA